MEMYTVAGASAIVCISISVLVSCTWLWTNERTGTFWREMIINEGIIFEFCVCVYLIANDQLAHRDDLPIFVLEHCREAETICWFSIFRGVSF
jgi:hypothetical protein